MTAGPEIGLSGQFGDLVDHLFEDGVLRCEGYAEFHLDFKDSVISL